MNSVILNYDKDSNDLFLWYQQLVQKVLEKRQGVLPIISLMPKDNHSVMQYYLDGPKIIFYIFFVKEKNSQKINSSKI